ncbi:DUF3139 domain-containing protein [Dialister sp.]|uniref:DUF3139 domain-containing protein n=1 Tax=Dialister sp. TaxID=1955814 RepID=UPI002E80E117|nr:DUF3139 domain-containing protein [Dialister sp.]MEE3453750.1 DUF3139 domain-containing protein [Dialister sp.]
MKNIIRCIIVMAICLLVLFILYEWPIQRYLALRNVGKYIKLQGADIEDISEKDIRKNFIQDGYLIDIRYKSDPEFIYEYIFSVYDVEKLFSADSVTCIVYDNNNATVDTTDAYLRIKYQPIEEAARENTVQ